VDRTSSRHEEDKKCIENIWLYNTIVRDNLEYWNVDWRIILKRILQNWNGKAWTGFITAHDRKKVTDCCEHCEETPGSINCGEFLDKADGLLVFQEGLLSNELMSYWFSRVRLRKIKHWRLLSDSRWSRNI